MSKLLTGFLAGVVVGILFAPDRGAETRRKIAEKGNDLKDKFNDFVDSLKNEADDLASEAKQTAQSYANKTQNTWPNS
jgi:gas vesicle protein